MRLTRGSNSEVLNYNRHYIYKKLDDYAAYTR